MLKNSESSDDEIKNSTIQTHMQTNRNQFSANNDNTLTSNNSTNDQVSTKTNDKANNVTAANDLYPKINITKTRININ